MLPSGTVTFLFTDVEGSTRLWAADKGATSASLLVHDAILRTAIESHGGYVFTTAGDSFVPKTQRAVKRTIAFLAAAGIALTGCTRSIAPPKHEKLLGRPPNAVTMTSGSRKGAHGGIGGADTSAVAFVVYASMDRPDDVLRWYRTHLANSYQTNEQNRSDVTEITAFSIADKQIHGNVTIGPEFPLDAVHAYSPNTVLADLPTAGPGARTYVLAVAAAG